jgi:hypothetical protein
LLNQPPQEADDISHLVTSLDNPEINLTPLKNYLIQNLKQLYSYDKTQIQSGIHLPPSLDQNVNDLNHNFLDLFGEQD